MSVLKRDAPCSAASRASREVKRSSTAPAQTPIVASTAKSRAATRPASPRGSVAKSTGAATKPIAATAPAQRPASQGSGARSRGVTSPHS